MQEVGAFEAKNKLAAWLDRVERGEWIGTGWNAGTVPE